MFVLVRAVWTAARKHTIFIVVRSPCGGPDASQVSTPPFPLLTDVILIRQGDKLSSKPPQSLLRKLGPWAHTHAQGGSVFTLFTVCTWIKKQTADRGHSIWLGSRVMPCSVERAYGIMALLVLVLTQKSKCENMSKLSPLFLLFETGNNLIMLRYKSNHHSQEITGRTSDDPSSWYPTFQQ